MSGRDFEDALKTAPGGEERQPAPRGKRAEPAWSVRSSAEIPVSGGRPEGGSAVPLHGRTPEENA